MKKITFILLIFGAFLLQGCFWGGHGHRDGRRDEGHHDEHHEDHH
jgi:hypothetical protein